MMSGTFCHLCLRSLTHGPLSRSRPHVLADDVVVPGLPIAEVSSNDEHVAGVAETKARVVLEADAEVKHSFIDGMGRTAAIAFGELVR